MLVGEASGGGRPEGVSPFVATVGVWQRLTTPASALRSGVVRSRVATVAGRAQPRMRWARQGSRG